MKKTTYSISMKETTSSISTKEISILRSKLIINMKTSRFKKVLHPASAGKSGSLWEEHRACLRQVNLAMVDENKELNWIFVIFGLNLFGCQKNFRLKWERSKLLRRDGEWKSRRSSSNHSWRKGWRGAAAFQPKIHPQVLTRRRQFKAVRKWR